ncbi:F-box protein At5g51370-like [Aristolochia californica]|uniref:F-box protein At5g51370-like n=1 Tax=Aristolochia californica TaxID=171875 RepID=UPI0035DC5F10
MPFSTGSTPRRKKPLNWPDLWFKERSKSFKHVVFKMPLDSPKSPRIRGAKTLALDSPTEHVDLTSLLSDELLLRILSNLPQSQWNPNSLVCKRWFALTGRLRSSIKLLDWRFLESRRLVSRFPNLTDVDLLSSCLESPKNCGVVLSHSLLSVRIDSDFSDGGFISEEVLLPSDIIDEGLTILARGCPTLRRLALIAATETGLSSVAALCPTLQELELHRCTDFSLHALSACENLQILRVIGCIDGFYDSVVSDIGLTILAHGCRRLVKLELIGCEGSYAGISAIGKCCPMLEELTICDHRVDAGWLAALPFCGNLKTLRVQRCKKIDKDPGPLEHLGSCPTLEKLQLQRCHLRDKEMAYALFMICEAVKEIELQDCWGLDNEMFSAAGVCRRVKSLSLEGCSLLTAEGLESVVISWKELQRLRVVSCKNMKGTEVSPALSNLFSVLKEFKWQLDSRAVIASSLAGTGIGSKGGRFFKRAGL